MVCQSDEPCNNPVHFQKKEKKINKNKQTKPPLRSVTSDCFKRGNLPLTAVQC